MWMRLYEYDLPEEEKINANGVPLVCVGREYIRTENEVERVKARVVKRYRLSWASEGKGTLFSSLARGGEVSGVYISAVEW